MPAIVAGILLIGLFSAARLPSASAGDINAGAGRFGFTPLSIAIPGGYEQHTIRRVNKDYENIRAWISSVGAAIAMNDLDGDGLPNDLCLVDTRIDQAVVAPTPGARESRYQSFVLDPRPLPINDTIAPSGCVPGDFNEDGNVDLLVYYLGRTPILFLARDDSTTLSARSYQPVELIAPSGSGTGYTGPQWQTTAVSVADFDGDGHNDIYVGNYFPHGPVLDDQSSVGVEMNDSMSAAFNGGEDYILRWAGGSGMDVRYVEAANVLPKLASKGWVLASSATDLDGDVLPELYLAQDFGPDRMFYNRSTPGNIRFSAVEGARKPGVPKSKRVGKDSFKGMGIDFGDLNNDGVYDMFISTITTSFGIEESNSAFVSTVKDQAALRTHLKDGDAPWDDLSTDLGLAWSGWGWDAKMGDFDNSGDLAIVHTTGFVKGVVNRWPQLQELATANDGLLRHPGWWPRVREGDDVGGSQHVAFYAKGPGGRYIDLSEALGLAVPVPTRGVATGDADGDGRLDLAIARQWDAPVFYRNVSPTRAKSLELRLIHDTPAAAGETDADGAGSPVVGAQATVKTSSGRTLMGHVDGGSGHSGKRSTDIFFGLGSDADAPVAVHLRWRDRQGQVHEQDLELSSGRHLVKLGSQAQEVK